MERYEFTLVFKMPDDQDAPEQFLDALYAAGFDDAVIGIGTPGRIAISIEREADSEEVAIKQLKDDVTHVLPEATLIRVKVLKPQWGVRYSGE